VPVRDATLSEGKRNLANLTTFAPTGYVCCCVRGFPPLNPPDPKANNREKIVAIAYAEVNTIQRTPTTNLVAGAAYILRGRFKDCNSGRVYDFRKIDDPPEYSATFMPPNGRYQDESELWSEAERLERRHDSRLGRRLILALPAEVSPEKRQQIVEGIAGKIVERWGCAITAAIHRPGKQGDKRNYHAHFLLSTRTFNQEGFLGEKIRVLDNPRTSRGEIEWLRQTCQEQINQFLSPEEQVDFRSYKRQGKDRQAQPHYGRKVIAWERKTGQKHEVRLEHEQFASNWNRQRELEREAERELQRQQQELERQVELERQRAEQERQAELERQRAEQERRQAELERQRQQQELERQKELERQAEQQRQQAELERQRELERQAELKRQAELERQAEYQKKYSYFASIKKLVNRYKNPQIGTDREGEVLLPDQTLKFSELSNYSLESLREVYQATRRKIERDLERRIGQLPPISQQIIGRCPLKELTDEGLIGLFPTVVQLEQSEKEEQQRREAERKKQEQELERQRQEQERQAERQRAEREKLRREQEENKKYRFFYVTKKMVGLMGNPQIGLATERDVILPDRTLKLSELKGYSLEFLEQSFLAVRRQVEKDLSRRISQLPPEMRKLLTHPVTEIEKVENLSFIDLINEVKALEELTPKKTVRPLKKLSENLQQELEQRQAQEKLEPAKESDPLQRLRERKRRRANQEEENPSQSGTVSHPVREYRSRSPDLEWD